MWAYVVHQRVHPFFPYRYGYGSKLKPRDHTLEWINVLY